METERMIYLVIEYASGGEIFGEGLLPGTQTLFVLVLFYPSSVDFMNLNQSLWVISCIRLKMHHFVTCVCTCRPFSGSRSYGRKGCPEEVQADCCCSLFLPLPQHRPQRPKGWKSAFGPQSQYQNSRCVHVCVCFIYRCLGWNIQKYLIKMLM